MSELLTGDESIVGTDASVRDFWAWAMSNLRTNTVRSMLGEYLVAKAVNAPSTQRIEWDPFDVQIPEGSIEVKSSGYLQAWPQVKLSTPQFSGLLARKLDQPADFGQNSDHAAYPPARYSETPSYNADVYVFALFTATSHDLYLALETSLWEFWVLPAAAVMANGRKSMGLPTVKRLASEWMHSTSAVKYQELNSIILNALAFPAPTFPVANTNAELPGLVDDPRDID